VDKLIRSGEQLRVVLILVDDDFTESDYMLPHLEEVVAELIMFFDFTRKGN
jgi:hypothetical protein